MLWIILTAAAAPLQVARNALQRGLVGDAGPWGATLVRFLFVAARWANDRGQAEVFWKSGATRSLP
jgi:hypothetical protein